MSAISQYTEYLECSAAEVSDLFCNSASLLNLKLIATEHLAKLPQVLEEMERLGANLEKFQHQLRRMQSWLPPALPAPFIPAADREEYAKIVEKIIQDDRQDPS